MNEYLISSLESQLEQDPSSRVFLRLAEELRRAGELNRSIDVCQSGLAHHPTYLPALVCLGRAQYAAGQIPEAEESFEKVLKKAPDNIHALRGLGDIADEMGRYEDALKFFETAALLDSSEDIATKISDLKQRLEDSPSETELQLETVSEDKSEVLPGEAVPIETEDGEAHVEDGARPTPDTRPQLPDEALIVPDLEESPRFDAARKPEEFDSSVEEIEIPDSEFDDTDPLIADPVTPESEEIDPHAAFGQERESDTTHEDEPRADVSDDSDDMGVGLESPPAEEFEPPGLPPEKPLPDQQPAHVQDDAPAFTQVGQEPIAQPTEHRDLTRPAHAATPVQDETLTQRKIRFLNEWLALVKDRHHVPR